MGFAYLPRPPICLGSTHHVAFGALYHTTLTEISKDDHCGVAVIEETFDLIYP